MKRVCLALVCVGLQATIAAADPANLENGVLIAHHPSGLQYSAGQDWCQRYFQGFSIDSCGEQHNRIDLHGSEGESSVWYVLAAWDESKEWCGMEFGFGEYDPDIYVFLDQGHCFPGDGLELPTVGWPGPNEGTALATTTMHWSGNFVPVYWFAGYAYKEGVIPLAADPANSFAGVGNCGSRPQMWEAALGGMGILGDGIYASVESQKEVPEDGSGGRPLLNLSGVTAVGRGVLMYGDFQWSRSDSVLYLFGQPFVGSDKPREEPPPLDPVARAFLRVTSEAKASATQAMSREEYIARFLEVVQPHLGTAVESCVVDGDVIWVYAPRLSDGRDGGRVAMGLSGEYPVVVKPYRRDPAIIDAVFDGLVRAFADSDNQGDVVFFGNTYHVSVPRSHWPQTARVMQALVEAPDPSAVDVSGTVFVTKDILADWLHAQRGEK